MTNNETESSARRGYAQDIVILTVKLLIAQHGKDVVNEILWGYLTGFTTAVCARLSAIKAFFPGQNGTRTTTIVDEDRWLLVRDCHPTLLEAYENHPSTSISVLGVIDDPNLRINGEDPFVDVVAYWPAKDVWTITHTSRADTAAIDYPVRVVKWQPLPRV